MGIAAAMTDILNPNGFQDDAPTGTIERAGPTVAPIIAPRAPRQEHIGAVTEISGGGAR